MERRNEVFLGIFPGQPSGAGFSFSWQAKPFTRFSSGAGAIFGAGVSLTRKFGFDSKESLKPLSLTRKLGFGPKEGLKQ